MTPKRARNVSDDCDRWYVGHVHERLVATSVIIHHNQLRFCSVNDTF